MCKRQAAEYGCHRLGRNSNAVGALRVFQALIRTLWEGSGISIRTFRPLTCAF